MDKHKEIFGLSKLPPKAYIKALEDKLKEIIIERGKDVSYIHELEDKVSSLLDLTPEELSKRKKKELLAPFKRTIAEQKAKLKQNKKDYSALFHKFHLK